MVGMDATRPEADTACAGPSADVVTISRQTVLNSRTGVSRPFSWVYTVTVPGAPYPMVGTGIGWARGTARKHAAGRTIVETWK